MKKLIFCLTILVLIGLSCRFTTIPLPPTGTAQPTSTYTPLPTFTPLPTATPSPTPLPEVRIEQADWALLIGDYELALQEYQVAFLQADTDEVRAASLVGMGHSHYLLGNLPQAIEAFNTVLDVYPEGQHAPKTFFLLGQVNNDLEAYAEAAAYWERYLELKPGILDYYIQELRGDAFRNAGDTSSAISAYRSALDAGLSDEGIEIEIKIARTYAESGDMETAIRFYNAIYEKTENDYLKAQMNFLTGQAYLQMGFPEQAYARFQDSVVNFPLTYDTYSGLEALVAAGEPVNSLDSGLVYYFAGQYGKAVESLQAYLASNPEHDGTAHHYLAFSLIVLGDVEGALAQWQNLIDDHPGDRYWEEAWDEQAYTLWAYLNRYDEAAETYINFVNRVPEAAEAPQYLYWAARLYEQNQKLVLAAETWERMVVEYPANDLSFRGMFLAGICYYRVGEYTRSQTTFQRLVLLSPDSETLAGAHLWLGKIHSKLGDTEKAASEWLQAAELDPTGYYSERAKELLEGKQPLQFDPEAYSLEYDFDRERQIGEAWLRSVFALPDETDLGTMGSLQENIHIRRGNALYEIGLYSKAGAEFDLARVEISADPVSNFKLLNYLLDLGFFKHAILISRQILNLANFDDASTLLAPVYFNRIRFGLYFSDLILPAAERIGLDPLILFSQIRQESFFEWYVGSTAGARGLMQLIPSTAQEIVSSLGWPPGYEDSDLYRPIVNIELGSTYLGRQMDRFGDENIYVYLAAYNAGPSNADNWYRLASEDQDLFLEVIRFAETRNYILFIAEAAHIYQRIYSDTLD